MSGPSPSAHRPGVRQPRTGDCRDGRWRAGHAPEPPLLQLGDDRASRTHSNLVPTGVPVRVPPSGIPAHETEHEENHHDQGEQHQPESVLESWAPRAPWTIVAPALGVAVLVAHLVPPPSSVHGTARRGQRQASRRPGGVRAAAAGCEPPRVSDRPSLTNRILPCLPARREVGPAQHPSPALTGAGPRRRSAVARCRHPYWRLRHDRNRPVRISASPAPSSPHRRAPSKGRRQRGHRPSAGRQSEARGIRWPGRAGGHRCCGRCSRPGRRAGRRAARQRGG